MNNTQDFLRDYAAGQMMLAEGQAALARAAASSLRAWARRVASLLARHSNLDATLR